MAEGAEWVSLRPYALQNWSEGVKDDGPFQTLHDIGLVTSAGFAARTLHGDEKVWLSMGTTSASVYTLDAGNLGVQVAIAEGPTATATLELRRPTDVPGEPIIHNPMIAFWRRAVLYYQTRSDLRGRGYVLRFEDYALIISDLGQSLYMLLGRHWNDEAKAAYGQRKGTPPSATPDLLALLEKYYPEIGWDLPSDKPDLWGALKDFVLNYYQDIIKHFEYRKFERVLAMTFEDLSAFMECTRQTWIWFVCKRLGLLYDPKDQAFADFATSFAISPTWRPPRSPDNA